MDFWKKRMTQTSEKDHLILFLRDVPIFTNLLPEEIQRFLSITREVKCHEGEAIMVEGQEGDTMFVILHGTVNVSKGLTLKTRGAFVEHEKTLTRLSADDHAIFGEVALFQHSTRTASITAVTECTLLEIRRDDFQRFAEANPSIGYRFTRNIAKIICERFRKADQDIIRLTTALSIALSRR
jgi:CRP/FNR family cyclic AMP-dependent transcriptional regulator